MLLSRNRLQQGSVKWRWASYVVIILLLAAMKGRLGDGESSEGARAVGQKSKVTGRSLLWMGGGQLLDLDKSNSSSGGDDDDDDDGDSNCSKPLRHHHDGYNDSCDYVRAVCTDVHVLVDYLALPTCALPSVKVTQHHNDFADEWK